MHIPASLQKIESIHNIKICFAVEAGSRAFGYASEDSDHDVRFIYIHRPEWYLSIDQGKDVIEEPISENLDISGWEMTKALRLFRKSNPSLLEWLQAETVYEDCFSFADSLRVLNHTYFQPKPALFHYLNIASANVKKISGGSITIKPLLNLIRSILSAGWIRNHGTFPPNVIDSSILAPYIKLKKSGHTDPVLLSKEIQSFIQREMEELRDYAESLRQIHTDPTAELNLLFQNTLKKAWPENRFR
ncbi:nucleotidyltransferase domain-containing protein [Bacillus sp. FJAT-42376]|uniref:nucleotidyltransferase domain-containing protein n=1 Tax=Bacillus sp. FJAT-42376 TaxID=2014076 RepID=UPI000F4F20FF|nr:nucleotidyltransferase domain-containing protein [Bacillus sp. FJAT-42376]AZB44378.1 nucleotidyltransferase domain-containing protein [Bacillus sp. FJAT-42376]